MNKSETIKELAAALSKFQGEITAVKKDASNPYYKSRYATLDAIWETIRKPLADNGLAVTQTLTDYGDTMLETTLLHTSGEYIVSLIKIKPVKEDPQSFGSALTYNRRYSLSAILGIAADEDDDGNQATGKDQKPVTKETVKPPVTPKPSPQPPRATRKPEPVTDGVIQPEPETPVIDIDEIKKQLDELQWTDVGNWLKTHFKLQSTGAKRVSDYIRALTPDQAAEFAREIETRKELR